MVVIKKMVHYLSLILYVLIIVYAIICIPILYGYRPLVVLSGSMEPTFKIGSVIYYKKIAKEELKEGDIITFKNQSNNFISHRVVSIDDELIETKGDANSSSDANKVRFEDIQGKDASVSIPYVGYYVRFVNENLIVAIILVVVILVSEFLFSNTEAFDINKNRNGEIENEK